MQCYHIYSETRGVYLTKNHYDSYSLKWYRWLKFVVLAHGLMELYILPGNLVYRDVEVSIAEVERSDPFPLLKRQPYGLWSFHLEGFYMQKPVQSTEIQNGSPSVIWFWNQKEAVVKP